MAAEAPDGTSTPRMPRYISPSAAGTFRRCPARWRYRYVDRLPDPPGRPALLGTFVHRILEELLELEPALRHPDMARTVARRVWPEMSSSADFLALELDEGEQRRFRWDGWHLVEAYFRMEDPAAVRVVKNEQRVRAALAGVPFMGIIDRVERVGDEIVVTDYKTGKAPTARFEGERLEQVLLYAAALAANGSEPGRARLMYLGNRTIEVEVSDEGTSRVVEALAATWAELGDSVEADEFPTRPGRQCGWCPYAEVCPDGRLQLGLSVPA